MEKKYARTDQSETARLDRVESLRLKTGKKLSALSISHLNSQNLIGNIENFIGAISLPLGHAGPLNIHFANSTEAVHAAFATSEGALVSSVSRGVTALNLSNGVKVRCIENTLTRAPAFFFNDLDRAIQFSKWVPTQFDELKKKVKEHSRHAVLLELQIKIIVQEVHVIFIYSTGEAAGQNMTTLITASLVQNLRQKYLNFANYWIENHLIDGNISSDKKMSGSLFSLGRGRKVIAEVLIPASVAQKIFKISNAQFCKNFNRIKTARVFAGYQGFNINVSNVVAALFLATGQDAACVHESSAAELHLEMQGEDLFVSLYMPALIVGTVGGGTHLPHAKSCLDLMSCSGIGSADKLAQIICAYALALELSTAAAIEGGQFVQAHTVLGRDSQKSFQPDDINAEFINSILIDQKNKLQFTTPIEAVEFDDAMMLDLASISARRISGLFRIRQPLVAQPNLSMLLKIKNADSDLIASSQFMLQSIDLTQIANSPEFKLYHPFLNSQKNEIDINIILSAANWDFVPKVFASKIVDHVGFLLHEEIAGAVKKFKSWLKSDIEIALKNLAKVHTYSKHNLINCELNFKSSKAFWIDLAKALMLRNSEKDPRINKLLNFCIERYDKAFTGFENLEKRFCHLDYNPRNLLFAQNQIFVIDWEFAGLHIPQRDLLEFMIFNLTEVTDLEFKKIFFDYCTEIKYPKNQWQQGLLPAFCDFVLRRITLYLVISEFKEIYFLETLLQNCLQFMELYSDELG